MRNGRRESAHRRGIWGEEQVAKYLQAQGAEILDVRWRCRYGELDLVAQWGEYLCLVEVKLRKSDAFAPARAFVTEAKQERLMITAGLYLQEKPTKLQPRFDVAEVYAQQGTATKSPEIIYWENAF